MPDQKPLEYFVTGLRLDAHGSVAKCKTAEVALDTDLGGRQDAFNPAELLLAALAACMIKGIERVTPMLRKVAGQRCRDGPHLFESCCQKKRRRTTVALDACRVDARLGVRQLTMPVRPDSAAAVFVRIDQRT